MVPREQPETEQPKTTIADLLDRIGISGQQLQGLRLGPGVVGRNTSIAWACELVMLAGAIGSAFNHNALLLGGSLIGAVLVALVICLSNVIFGSKNTAAALLEGAHFLQYQHLEMAAKGVPRIELSPPMPAPALPENADSATEEKK